MLVRPCWNNIIALCIIGFLVWAPHVTAQPVIDPELLDYANGLSGPGVTTEDANPVQPIRPVAISIEDGREYANVWMSGSVDPTAIERLGGQVNSIAGPVMTVRIPLDAVGQLAGLANLERVQLAQRMEFQADVLMQETGINMLWGGLPPNFASSGVTGEGVVVGIVDTGVDPTHQDFITPAGTRIKYLWDQSVFVGSQPIGFSYGAEYASGDINAGACSSIDVYGHGTHVAGVASGNGRATGNGQPAFTYVGAAPEADLVVVKLKTLVDGTVTDDKVLDGVRYVFERAAALNKPAVVLLAVTKTTGPHDGNDPLDLGISALTGPGKLVVVSAGNYGGKARHAEWKAAHAGDTGDISLNVPSYFPSASPGDHFTSEAWYKATARFDVTVITPSGEQVGPVAWGNTAIGYTNSGVVQVRNGMYSSANGSHRVLLHVFRGDPTRPPVANGEWKYRFHQTEGLTHRVDTWISSYALGSAIPKYQDGMTEAYLVGAPATANGVLSVASYSTKRYWTAVDGRTYFLPNAVVGEIDGTSSPGPRRDGVQVPHVAAPGLSVASSRSNQYYPSTMYIMPDSAHTIRYGTSVAAASVTGAVALLLQNNPVATPQQALQMVQNAATDNYTGAVPNNEWGYGKLRATNNVAGVVADGNPSVGFALASRNPARGPVSFEFSLSAADAAHGARLSILDVSGREVAAMNGSADTGLQRLTWNGRTRAGAKAAAGVYWAQLKIGAKASTQTFVYLK